jgi:hypothetical protein
MYLQIFLTVHGLSYETFGFLAKINSEDGVSIFLQSLGIHSLFHRSEGYSLNFKQFTISQLNMKMWEI